MTREQVLSIFAEATGEQITNLLNIHSADIGKAKAPMTQLQADLDAARKELQEAKNTISTLEKSTGDVEELKKQIEGYKAAELKRSEEAKAAAERAELEERFNAVTGERKFLHDMVRTGVMAEFDAALKDKANRGKGDAEIFETLTKDKGYFANQNPAVPPQPGMGNPAPTNIKTREEFLKMSFTDQMKFKEQNAAQFAQLFHPTK